MRFTWGAVYGLFFLYRCAYSVVGQLVVLRLTLIPDTTGYQAFNFERINTILATGEAFETSAFLLEKNATLLTQIIAAIFGLVTGGNAILINIGGGNRGFGLVFFAVFAVIGFIWRDSAAGWFWFAASIGVLTVALVAPKLLSPFNRIWFRFGVLLGKVTTPIVMGFLFYLVVTPTGLIFKVLGKDPLRLRFDREGIERRPPGPDPTSMNQQF